MTAASAPTGSFGMQPTTGTSLQPGQKFGTRYTIIKILGAGGMGAVYQAWDESLGIAVALKVIRIDASTPPDQIRDLEARFKRELLLARKVTHPNVVRIHDLGELGDTKYLTMAFVDGADLATVLRRDGRLPIERALSIMRQITEGLKAAHAIGIVHRDLKPANVMIEAEDRALLTDFGIARSIDASTLHTNPGAIVGTLDYMAPEQARGEPADRRTDVYALGLIFYELLTGGRARPRSTGGFIDLVARVQKGPPPLAQVAPDVPAGVVQIVGRCLETDPAARYQSAAELLEDLNTLGPDGQAVAPIAPSRSIRPWLLAAAGLLVILVAAGAWWASTRTPAPAPAVQQAPVRILIADFENRTGESVFQGSLEQALAIAMEGAPFITSYSRVAAAKLAEELRPGAPLDASAALLVGVRENLGAVLAGSIAPDSAGYRLEVRASRPGAAEEPFATVRAGASDKGKVLEAIGRLAGDLRKALGDTKPSVELQAETFTAASLEAVKAYTLAQNLSTDRKNEEAIELYKQAIQHDAQFGRAYAGLAASLYDLGRRKEAEELWKKALSLMDRMTEREKYRTLGVYYITVARNYEKAIDEYRNLVEKYPADLAGHNNLALAYFYTLDFDKAREYGKLAIDVYPDSLKFRNNYALYAMYAGDFKTAAEYAQQFVKEDPKYEAAYLPLAMAALSEGDVAGARGFYQRAGEAGPAGASLASIGLADVALTEGRWEEAQKILEAAIPVDRESGNTHGVVTKLAVLAEATAALRGPLEGARVLEEVLKDTGDEFVIVPAGRLLARAGQKPRVLALVRKLEESTQPVPRSYARILAGELALHERRFNDAIQEFAAAIKIADLWLARYGLGVAYVEAGRHAEALSELEACLRRRGEATAIFLDDVPSYRYAIPVRYWLGRAQQGLNMPGATASFEQFLKTRSAGTSDPLVIDAQKRLGDR